MAVSDFIQNGFHVGMESWLGAETASSAVISKCERYRYRLERRWGRGSYCLFVMLNPSTADASKDDPTIRKCVGFAKRWGHAALVVVNLFAWRATDPHELTAAEDPVGGENDGYLIRAAAGAGTIVAAWGRHGRLRNRDVQVKRLLEHHTLNALGSNKDGTPKHPLYVPHETQLTRWL